MPGNSIKYNKGEFMNIIGVIPARYNSTRFPGKPLADICGKPMIWWVYNQVKKVKELSEVYVATDDERIKKECDKYGINVVMTRDNHKTVFERIHEFSDYVKADFYVIINGDEPLINPEHIKAVIKPEYVKDFVINTISEIESPSETNDISNIKVVFDKNMNALYMSRLPIPFPNKSIDFNYWKHVGITGINKKSLDEYIKTPPSTFEKIEGIDHLRFVETQKMKFVKLNKCETLSVDTPKDLEKVRKMLKDKQL